MTTLSKMSKAQKKVHTLIIFHCFTFNSKMEQLEGIMTVSSRRMKKKKLHEFKNAVVFFSQLFSS